MAWKVEDGKLVLGQWGDCFIPHTPGNMNGSGGILSGHTVSFELYNQRGYYIMQKNYMFVASKKEDGHIFSKLFALYRRKL